MRVVEETLTLTNLIKYSRNEAIEKRLWEEGIEFLSVLELDKGLYQNGPLFFSMKECDHNEKKAYFDYYMPICWNIDIKSDTLEFVEKISFKKVLMIRQADEEEDFMDAVDKIKKYAEHHQMKLSEVVYFIFTPIYDDLIVDIYIEVLDLGDKGQ